MGRFPECTNTKSIMSVGGQWVVLCIIRETGRKIQPGSVWLDLTNYVSMASNEALDMGAVIPSQSQTYIQQKDTKSIDS
ncbi:hypothetical protein Pmani_014631 [Petrolisthes manimaculis]|uniref:Uncharacterized protein n=1 Tax=Petrolisthes manimaculis TaxID=1843537 RepID=A0AAE1PVD4_9EUCA|nr:hypothetical protein Pmani_014631 [Petrolisthes manimaculis]